MKKLLFLLPVFFLSCGPKQVEKKIIVNGKIINPKTDKVIVSLFETSDTTKIEEDGTFYLKFEINKPQYGLLRSDEISHIFLSPGDSLYVEIDAETFDETMVFSGEGAEINNYLSERMMLKERFVSPSKELYKLNETDFVERTDSVLTYMNELYNKFISEKNISNDVFLKLEPKNIEYFWATFILRYPRYHKYYAKDTLYQMSESLWEFMDAIEIENAEYLQLKYYNEFFDTYFSNEINKIYDKNEDLKNTQEGFTLAQFEFIKNKMTDPDLKSKKAGEAMYNHARYNNTENIDGLMTDFLALCNDSAKIDEVNDIIDKKRKLTKGMPAPNFTTVDVKDNEVNLSDFKGKYVYIDFWASWCGPCRQEIPHFKKLSKDYKAKDVVFLSVSVDARKNDWEKAIETHDLSGNLLYIGSGNKIIKDDYMVYGIPRFVLVDPEGNFVASNAPRPSTEKIREILDELI